MLQSALTIACPSTNRLFYRY